MPVAALAGFALCYLLIVAGIVLLSLPFGLIAAGALGLAFMYAVAELWSRAPKPDGP